MERAIVLLVVAVALVQAGPLKSVSIDSQCSQSCTANGKLNYQVGKTYRYQYEADVQSSVFGAMEDYAGLHLSSNVQMEILSKCELVMKLTDVSLTEYDQEDKIMKSASKEFKEGLERNPIRISFQDGNVEELCLTEKEPEWVVNAKRGILSLFQTNMADFSKNETLKETDVSGTCDTEYYIKDADWYTTDFGKSKKLHTCTDRHSFNTVLQGVPYTANSEYQSLPIVKSDQNCEYKIDKQSHHISSVHCQESHMFRPFSKDNSGAVTNNEQTLTFIESTQGTSRSGPSVQKVSLKFSHNNGEDQESISKRELTQKLMEICEKTKLGARPETPRLFTELVYIVKRADVESLNAIYVMLEKGTICKDNNERTSKFFMDTLPLAGTGASLNLMVKLMATNSVTGIEADMWLTSIAFIKNPDVSVLKEVKPLINMKDSEDKTLLSIGTLIHNYCNQRDCQEDRIVRALLSAIENKMAPRCKVNEANYRATLMALRAIGNAGWAQSTLPSLNMCMGIKSNPIEIRLSAIEAFRRIPCTASRNSLFSILKDVEEDSELRIAAYKSIMECPTEETLTSIKKMLEKEGIQQVGSYIWSHLTNLMETSDRHKQSIKEILEDETFKKEFDLDMMKYSRNYEKSVFVEPVNSGAKIEGDLIWSPKSFIPRSSMLNLTVDLFGQSVNLMEFGGRAEGLEYFFEAFIGPNGYFGDAASQKSESNNLALKSVRPDKIRKIDRRFESKAENLRASLYMRVFGNELKYYNIRGLDDLLTGSNFNIIDMLTQISKENDATYSYSTMFLDSSMIIPTGSGFPMSLTVNGTSTIDLKMNGKIDLKNSDVVGYIKPSAAIDISSLMSVDAFVTKCGIKMVSTLHTSTSVQGKVHLSPSGTLTAEYEMPQNKMEVFDFKTSFFTVHREQEREQRMIEDNRQTKRMCSPAKLVTFTGLELCTEISYPNASLKASGPYFPLTGRVSGGLYLYNRDTHTKYVLQAKSSHTRAENVLHFKFDTPGSKVDRQVSFNMNLNKKDLSMGMTLTSPWLAADLQGLVLNSKKTKGINGKLNIDGVQSYAVKAQVDIDEMAKTKIKKYTPSIRISAHGMKPINIQAIVRTKSLNLLAVDFNMEGILVQPVEAKVDIKNNKVMRSLMGSLQMGNNSRYSFESSLRISSFGKKTQYKPLVSVRTPQLEVLAIGGTVTHVFGKKIDYTLLLDKIVKKKVSLKGFFQRLVYRRGRVLFGVKTELKSAPFDLKLFSKLDNKNFRSISTNIAFNYINRGVLINGVSRNGIQFVSKITNLSSASLTKAKASLALVVKRNPEYNLKMISNIDHNSKLTLVFADISYGADFKDKTKQIDLDFEMSRKFKSWIKGSADLKSRLRFPAMNLNVAFTGTHSHSDRHIASTVNLKGGKTFEIESGLHWKDDTKNLIAMTGNYTIAYPGRNFMVRQGIQQKTDHTYIFKTEVQPQKNQMNTVITQLNVPSPGKSLWKVFSDITPKNEQPIHVEGLFDPNPLDFVTKVSYEKESKKFSGSVVSKTTKVASDLKLEVEYPQRLAILNLNGKYIQDKYSGFADFKWDAAKDAKKKLYASFWLEEPTEEKINGSVSLSYPSRDLSFNLLHQIGSKYSTKADFSWDKNSKISADTTLGIKAKSVICTAKLTTPFATLPSLNVKLSHNEDNEEYLTKVNVDYKKSESVNMVLKLKKPLSLKTFVGYFLTTSSMKGLKRARVDFDHKLNPLTKMDSMVKFLWNKQQVQANFELKNTTKANRFGFMGDLTLQTTFSYMKRGIVKFSHDNDGTTFNTAGSVQRNKKLYELKSTVTHSPSSLSYAGTGKIDMSSPTAATGLNWDHRLSLNSIKSSTTVEWGMKRKSQIGLRVKGNTDDMVLGINLDTPFKPTGDVEVTIGLNKDNTPYKATMDVKQNGGEMASLSAFFDHSNYNTEGRTSVRIPAFDINSRISGKHVINRKGLNTEFEAVITPAYTVEINSVIKKSEADPFTHTVVFQSSMENLKRVMYTAELRQEQMNTFTTRLEYGAEPVVEFQTNYILKANEKQVHFLLKTPYDNIQSMSGDINFAGNADQFNADSTFEIVPLLKKKTASLNIDLTKGLKGKAVMDTFFKTFPTLSMDVNANLDKDESDVSVSLSIQSTPYMSFKFIHDITNPVKKTMSADAAYMTSSFGVAIDHTMRDNFIRSDVSLYNDNSKYAGAVFQIRNDSKIEGLFVISPPAKRDIELSMTLDGPSTHVEMRHNRQHHFTYDMELSSSSMYKMDIRSSWQIASICPDTYDSQMNFEFTPNARIATNGYFMKSSVGKSEFDVLFDVTHAIEGNLIIKSPLMKNIKASLNHMTGNKYCDSKASLYHGGKEMLGGAATMNYESSIIGELTFRSAFTKKIQTKVSYDGKLDNFVINIDTSYGKDKMNVELSSNVATSVVQQKISVSSTLTNDLNLEVSHLGDLRRFTSFVELNNGSSRHRLDLSYENDNKLDWSAALVSPHVHPMSSRLTVTGTPLNFKSHVEFIRNTDRSDFNIELVTVSPRLSGSIELTSPYMEDFALTAEHSGYLPSFTSSLRLAIDKTEIYDARMNLMTQPSIESSLTINTPTHNFEGLIKHEGAVDNFKSHAEFSSNYERSEFDVSFKSLKKVKGLINLKSPLLPEEISLSFEHSGELKNFMSQAEYVYGSDRAEIDMSLNVEKNVAASVSVQVPRKPKMTLNLKHASNLKNLNTNVQYLFGTERSDIDFTISTTDSSVTSSFNLVSPYMDDISVNIKHEGQQRNFVSTGDVSIGGRKSEASVMLNLDSMETSVGIISPMSTLKFTHTGFPSDFKSSFDFTNDTDRYTGMLNVFVGKTVDFNMKLTSPIPEYEMILAVYKHEGNSNNFQCHAEFELPDGKSECDLKVDVRDLTDMSFTLDLLPSSRFDLKPIKAVYTFKKENNEAITSTAEFNNGRDENKMHIKLQSTEGLFTLNSVYTPTIRSEYDITKSSSNFRGNGKLLIDGDEKGHIALSFDSEKNIDVVFSVKAPSDDIPKINGDLTIAMTPTSFRDSYSIFVDDVKKGGLDMSLDLDDKIEGSLTVDLLTDRYALDMSFTKSESKYTGKSDVTINNLRKAGFDSSLDLENGIVSSLAVDLLANRYALDMSFTKSESKYTGKSDVTINNLRKAGFDSSLDLENGIVTSLAIDMPFENISRVDADFHFRGDLPKLELLALLKTNNKQVLKVNANIPHGELSLATPFEGFEKTDITFYHEGTLDNFKMGGKIVYASSKDIKIDVEHMLNGNMLKCRFSLTSMYTDTIVLTAYHNGESTDFLSKYAMFVGTDNKIESETTFKKGSTALDFHTTLSTTMSGETFVQRANLKLAGTSDNFNTDASIEHNDKAIRFDSSFKNGPILEGSAKLTTPFESNEEMKASFSHSGKPSNFMTMFEVQYMPKETISGSMELINKGWRQMDTTVVFKTPFEGLEENRFVYKHTGDSSSFQCEPALSIGATAFSGTIKASKSPLSVSLNAMTPFEGYRSLNFDSNVQMDKRGRYSTRMETSWGQGNNVILDGSFSSVNNRIQGSVSLTTPFEEIRNAAVQFVHHDMPAKYTESFLAKFNGENLIDFDVDFNLRGENKHFLTTLRSPQPMKFEVSGDFSPMSVDMDMIANFDTMDSKSEMKLEAGYDFRFTTKKADFKLTRPGQVITYKGEFAITRSKSDLSWGISSAEKTGFDLIINNKNAILKVLVPGEHARVLELSGLYNNDMLEADFYWDADVDRSRKFGFRTTFTDRTNTLNGAVSVMVPALQRTIQVESDVSVFRGRVVFDGKLSFSFSRDERKKVVMMARVEDVSTNQNSMNYSMTFGLNQPYTNLGIRMYSHLGKSSSRYSAVMGMEYMTGKRQTKTFHMGGEMDRQNNFMCFEMVSPLKTLNISGNVKTQNEFHVSIVNKYDQKRPLQTAFTLNPTQRFIDFHTNYDLEHPMNELQMRAEYVNSSALKFDIHREVDYTRITDVLATARLNSSHLLHSRLHWRPEILEDLEAYYNTKMDAYKRRIKETVFTAGEDVLDEIYDKSTAIHSMIEGEIGRENMNTLERVFSPIQFYIVAYVNRAILHIENSANSTWNTYNSVSQKYQLLSEKTQEAMNTMQSPFMMPLPIDQPFDYAMEMVNIPVKHLPAQSARVLKYAKHILPEAVNSQLVTMNKNWDLESNYKSTVETILKMIEKEIVKDILKLKKIIRSTSGSPFTIYDPKHGEIQAEFHLPIPLKSLDAMPVVNFIRYYNMLKERSSRVSVRLPEISGEWVPPYTGTATVSQGRTITTFDGLTYDIDSDCTFILTKDYRDGNFTVIRSNGEDPSITILSQTKPVELKLNGEVFIGGEAVELPVKNNIISVSQIGESVTVEGKDFTVLFNTATDYLTVKINGWYFGKTGGLLGIYDNEPSNDRMTSFGKVIDNNNRFAKTWEVGKATCR